MRALEIGQTIWVKLDSDNVYEDHWTEMKITSIAACHQPMRNYLCPYIGVGVDHERLRFLNYSLYCENDYVRLGRPKT